MRNLNNLNRFRLGGEQVVEMFGWEGDSTCGLFMLPSPVDNRTLRIIAAAGEGWEHVSVSLEDRCPHWEEMEFIKQRFFNDDEVVMQLHVKKSDHINCHPYCLHLWRPTNTTIPVPPSHMVGPKT